LTPFDPWLPHVCEKKTLPPGVREAMRDRAAVGANGTAGVTAGGHLSRTFARLDVSGTAEVNEDERSALRRKQLMVINARDAGAAAAAAAAAAAGATVAGGQTNPALGVGGVGERGSKGEGGRANKAAGNARAKAAAPSSQDGGAEH
jgi:hypothetical protein